jgi:hypothetical protein
MHNVKCQNLRWIDFSGDKQAQVFNDEVGDAESGRPLGNRWEKGFNSKAGLGSRGRPGGSNRLVSIGSEVKAITKFPFQRESERGVSIVLHVMI